MWVTIRTFDEIAAATVLANNQIMTLVVLFLDDVCASSVFVEN